MNASGFTPLQDPADSQSRLDYVQDIWDHLEVGDDPGESLWEELRAIHLQVTAALKEDPPQITKAECLTAYAALLVTGQTMH